MTRLMAVAGFALLLATSAHAMTVAPLYQPDSAITNVAFGCGLGRTRVGGICASAATLPVHGNVDKSNKTQLMQIRFVFIDSSCQKPSNWPACERPNSN